MIYEEVKIDVYTYYFRNIRKINGENSEVVENEFEKLFLDYDLEENITITPENRKFRVSTDNKQALFAGVQVEVNSFESNDELNSKLKKFLLVVLIFTISSILSYYYLDKKSLYRED